MKEQLEKIQHWHFVHNKKLVLDRLKKESRGTEEIYDMIDGFFSSGQKGKGSISGVLLITDRGLLFVSNDKKDRTVAKIPFGDISGIENERGSSSVTMKIDRLSGADYFRSFITAARAGHFAEKVKDAGAGTAELTSSRSAEAGTDMLARNYVEHDAMPEFLKKITEAQKELTGMLDEEINKDESRSEDEKLFKASKVILTRISGCLDEVNDTDLKQTVMDDIIVLSSLAGVADGSLSESELLLISLVLLPLNPGDDRAYELLGAEIKGAVNFPQNKKKEILQYWDHASKFISERGLNQREDMLPSLAMIRRYDDANGSLHFDTLSAAYTAYAQALMKADGSVNDAEKERLEQINSLIATAAKISSVTEEPVPEEETLEEVMEKINELVGMDNIKGEIQTFINLVKIQKERRDRGLPETPLSLHAVFYGPPGTGKTTIARLLGRVYRCLGLLKKGHLIETDRAGLVAGYVGQTATKTDEVVQKALDGVLFIDEAYALAAGQGGQDFGREAVDTILKRMEDHRERLAVIVAGYPDEMKVFIESNPGLKSRFRRYYYFDHYEPDALMAIFEIFSGNVAFTLEEDAKIKLKEVITKAYEARSRTFGNGRLVRNLFEKIVEQQANRIAAITPLTEDVLCTIKVDDVPDDIGNLTYGFHE